MRGQCDNTDVWTVPYDGSSGIILSVTEKRVGLGDCGLWERIDLEGDYIRGRGRWGKVLANLRPTG